MTEWITVHKHLQSVGSATCDVSLLILQAEILRTEEKNSRAAEILMSAARDVLRHRKLARRSRAALTAEKPRPIRDGQELRKRHAL